MKGDHTTACPSMSCDLISEFSVTGLLVFGLIVNHELYR